MRSLLLILILGVLGDITTTYIGFTRMGCGIERNPLTRITCYNSYLAGVMAGGLEEFTILYILFRIYEAKAPTRIRYYFMSIVALLPYIAVVNNILFLLSYVF